MAPSKSMRSERPLYGMFAMATQDTTIHAIAETLKFEGIRGLEGAEWSDYMVSQVLHNPVYAGYQQRGGVPKRNGHPAIVDDKTFNIVQAAIYLRRRSHTFRSRPPLIIGPVAIEARLIGSGTGGSGIYLLTHPAPDLPKWCLRAQRTMAGAHQG